MTRKKKEIKNQKAITEALNQCKELKAGELADFFNQLDPNASVYNIDEGEYIVKSPEDGTDLDLVEDIQKCDNTNDLFPYAEEEPIEKYGDDVDISDYDTGNITEDMCNMDTDFAQFITQNQINLRNQMCNLVDNLVLNNTKYIIDNVVNYQNTKNKRGLVEVARIVGDKNE